MIWLKRLLTPPRFEDEGKTQQAYMLHIIVWTLTLVPIPLLIYYLILTPANLERPLVQSVIAEAINITLLIMLRHGHVRGASLIQITAFWLFFTITSVTGAGVQGESYLIGYSLVIAVAGMLLGGRGATVFTVLSLLTGLVILNTPTWGLKSNTFVLDSPPTTWVVSLVLFPVAPSYSISPRWHCGMHSSGLAPAKNAIARSHKLHQTIRFQQS